MARAGAVAMTRMKRQRLLLLSVLLVAGLLVLGELARGLAPPATASLAGRLLLAVAFVGLFAAGFALLSRRQIREHLLLERQNRALRAVRQASRDLHGELDLGAVLQRIVDQARQLVRSRYGAITVVDESGRIEEFLTSGMDPDHRQRIGEPPQGRGLLGIVLKDGQTLRLPDISADPRSVGFPDNHPVMRSLLAVPVPCASPFRGNLYLSEAPGGRAFTPEDEEHLTHFAAEAGLAIDNAHVHRSLSSLAIAEERLLLGREIHDGMAQVLAFVNTKLLAVREYLTHGHADQAVRQLEELSAATRDAYTDVREGILALRSQPSREQTLTETLEDFVGRWQLQSGIEARFSAPSELRLPPTSELHLLRMIQEALANVRKHSRARHVEVSITEENRKLTARIADDGVGFDSARPAPSQLARFGLAIMRERAQSVDGVVAVESRPGGGTTVLIELPVSLGAPTDQTT